MIAFYFGLFVLLVVMASFAWAIIHGGSKLDGGESRLTPGMAAELERLKAMQQIADADGWIPHDGGECPVPGTAIVDVKFRDWIEFELGNHAWCYEWSHINGGADIIAYRLHKPERAVKEFLTTADAFTIRPNWDEAPEWAEWAAQDQSGKIWWFSAEPTAEDGDDGAFGYWALDNYWALANWELFSAGPANPNWKQAIERRPVNIAALEEKWKKENTKAKPGEPLLPRIPTEKDGSELISREELAELRRKGEAYDDLAPMYAELYEAARRYVRNHQSQKNFERLAEAAGEELA